MNAPKEILEIWQRFDAFPMETLTKAWHLRFRPSMGQRSVEQMKEHRAKTGASGNCFDLAIWLRHEFQQSGVESYFIAEQNSGPPDHVAVIALDTQGRRFLCDLGDLWIQPILVDPPSGESGPVPLPGFFTGARVCLHLEENTLRAQYLRSQGKASEQFYDLTPLKEDQFREAAEECQRSLSRPLVEMRQWLDAEVVHWEFDRYRSFVSSLAGLHTEDPAPDAPAWASRIAKNTGMEAGYVLECLNAFEELSKGPFLR